MLKPTVLAVVLSLLLLLPAMASAQAVCPLDGTTSGKLVCVIPQVYGPFGLGTTPSATTSVLATGFRHEAHFENDFINNFGALNTSIGTQVSQLPTMSPTPAITFQYDAALKTFVPSKEESLGPIIGERASTIGRGKLFVAVSYQHFDFTSIDGQSLHSLPLVLQHRTFPPPFPPGVVACPNQGAFPAKYAGNPCFVRDFIGTVNSVNLKVHQAAMYATFGLSANLDVSVVIPILDVQMGATSLAHITQNAAAPAAAGAPGNAFHQFNPQNPALSAQCASFAAANQPCFTATFSDTGGASGLGDVLFRGKYAVYRGEHIGVAAGADLRVPSGDALNFLGAGSWGFRPFGVVSYSARIAPHAEVGYELNSDSVLGGDMIVGGSTGPRARGPIPKRFVYIVGADAAIVKRLTASFDIYGQRLFSAPQVVSSPYTDLGQCTTAGAGTPLDPNCAVLVPGTTHPNLSQTTTNIGTTDAAVGVKFRALEKLIISGNVLLKLDDGGLRSRATPLVGVSYSF